MCLSVYYNEYGQTEGHREDKRRGLFRLLLSDRFQPTVVRKGW